MIKWSPPPYARQGNFRLFQILTPECLVFHLPEAGQAPRWNASRCRNVYSCVNLGRAGRSPGSLAHGHQRVQPVPGRLVAGRKWLAVPWFPGSMSVAQGAIRGLLSADRQGWKRGKLPSKRRIYHLLRLVTKAALWGAFSRLASWLMGKILS